MSVEFDRESPGKFDSRTLKRKTLSRWTGRSSNNSNSIDVFDSNNSNNSNSDSCCTTHVMSLYNYVMRTVC